MMDKKERYFAPLIHVSLEELVPHDHFYRHLERTLDLSFVREFVQETYACCGIWAMIWVSRFPIMCAVSAFDRLLHRSRRLRATDLLGRLPYLASKDQGDNSMSATRLNAKGWSVKRRKSCPHGEAWIG